MITKLILISVLIGNDPRSAGQGQEQPAPDGWRSEAPRAEIAPLFFRVERAPGASAADARLLGLAGQGNAAVDGRWVRVLPVKAGTNYRFTAEYQARDVDEPERSVLARVVWLGERGKRVETPEYPRTRARRAPDGWSALEGTYLAPAGAVEAQLELHLRWAPRGEVRWRGAELKPVAPPAPRLVRLASINHRPRGTKSPEENLEQFAALVGEASSNKADIVCLPEGVTVVGNGKTYVEVAEPIPGPSTRFLGEVARKHGLYLVAGLYERDATVVYNTSVLIGRDGTLIGKYRKVCLPREEIEGGITPGAEYPVFDTDFGRVGMMICWDVHFPEVARELAARGAEVIFMPIWGGNETLAQARAIENQIYLVASGYDFKTAIYDKAGEAVASTTADPMVIVTEVDLNRRLMWPWLGDWRARIWREGPSRAPAAHAINP
jgi:predicted amidohydrolase